MTLLDFEELCGYWAVHPPVHLVVAACLGPAKRTPGPRPFRADGAAFPPADPAALLAELGPGFGIGDVHAGFAPVVLDIAELRRREKAV